MDKSSRIYIAGHNGLVGSALERKLVVDGFDNIVSRSSQELDLRDQAKTDEFFNNNCIKYVFLAAARVGGIMANIKYPAEFIFDNVSIQSNVIHSAYKSGVKKLLFFGSNCMYPKECEQPMSEEMILSGKFEPTNEAYAAAKISGMIMCQSYNKQYGTNFITVIPASLFGPRDNYDAESSHFVAALIKKFHDAKVAGKKEVNLWGTGKARREILYVDDLAEAAISLMEDYNSSEPVNIGIGKDYSIGEVAEIIKRVVDFDGEITFDTSKPDGMMRKLLDVKKITQLGWTSKTDLEEALRKSYDWFKSNFSFVSFIE